MRRDLRPGRRRQPRIDQRHLERLDAELPGTPLRPALVAALALERHLVEALLGRLWDRPAHRPRIRQRHHLARRHMGDVHLVGLLLGLERGQPALGFQPQPVLHRHGFPDAQQRAVEHRVGAHRVAVVERAAGGRVVEAPRLDALAPAAENERQVAPAIGTGRTARSDEQAVVAQALVVAHLETTRNPRHALRIGAARPEHVAPAVVHRHVGIRHRLGAVECRHPDKARRAPALEMHAHRRHQHPGADVHRRFPVEQLPTQHTRRDFHDVVPRAHQRQPEHFGRAGRLRRVRAGAGQVAALHVAFLGQQRDFPRADHAVPRDLARLAVVAGHGFGDFPVLLRPAGVLGGEAGFVVALDLGEPLQDVLVGRARIQRLDVQPRFRRRASPFVDTPHGDRQHPRLGRSAQLDHAKRRRRELRQRRHPARRRLQRKRRRIRQPTARSVAEVLGQRDLVTRVFVQRRGEVDDLDGRLGRALGELRRGGGALPVRTHQPELRHHIPRHRR
ncbi:MAG: hypothetical protein RL260_4030 [Pseudomonadota bacterium]